MSLFRPATTTVARLSAELAELRGGWDSVAEIIAQSRGGYTYAGVPVDDEQALRLGAAWQCIDLLAELVSTMPIDRFKQPVGGRAVPLPSTVLLTDPAGDNSGFEAWCRQVMESLLMRGNTFGLITGLDDRLYPRQIEVLHPDRVTIRRALNFGPVEWYLDNKEIERYPDGPLWHLAAYNAPGSPLGRSPIRYAAETLGLGIATRRFGAQWFGDGAHPTSIITHETEPMPSETDARTLKARVKAAMHDNREPLIMGGGWKLEPIQIAPEESQFLETSKANADDVARFFFRRPPGEGGEITYANVEARSIDLLTYTVNGWLVRLERALSRLMPRGQFAKFNAGALLRTDLKTRYEAHVLAVRGGIATPNERRELEDMPPIPGADELLWPPYATKVGDDEAVDEGDDEL